MQGAGTPAHHPPALTGIGGVDGLSDDLAGDLQHGVAAHDHLGLLRVGGRHDVEGLSPSQGLDLLGGGRGREPGLAAPSDQLVEHGLFIHVGDPHQRLDPCGSQGGQSAG